MFNHARGNMSFAKLTLSTVIGSSWFALTAAAAHAQSAPVAPAHKVFVEGGLGYGYGMSNSQFIEINNGTKLDSPSSRGPALDLAGGYMFLSNLAVYADLQYASASTISGQNDNGDRESLAISYSSFALGLRTTVPAGPGEVYAQFALGFVLPFETERNRQELNGDSRSIVIGYNSGFGARGDHYNVNERLYIAGGLRLQGFATDNVGRDRVRTDKPSGNVEREVYSTDPNANNTARAEALSVQDLRIRLGVGYRF
jgi:Outer membrane protein beta-barrel domain